jgi:hypothetical protein
MWPGKLLWALVAACIAGCGARSDLAGLDDTEDAAAADAVQADATGAVDASSTDADASLQDARPTPEASVDVNLESSADAPGDADAGYVSCGPNDVLVGDACVRLTCTGGDAFLDCLLADGTIGHCQGLSCNTVDLSNDPNNCGRLGEVCPAGGLCLNRECSIGCSDQGDCPPGLTCDTAAGGCALPKCAAGDDYRACPPLIGQFVYPGTCCGTSCVSLDTDNKNCGYCGHACPAGVACLLGACDTDCASAQNNVPCEDAYNFCCNGRCVSPDICNTCGSSCVSCTTAGQACGAGEACTVSGCAATSCDALADGTSCAVADADGAMHLGKCCAGSCGLRSVDPENCGLCGKACPAGQACLAGVCTPSASCEGKSTGVPGFRGVSTCVLPSGQEGLCCDGRCVDIEADNDNCTSCNLTCPVGSACGVVPSAPSEVACLDAGAPVGCGAANPCPPGFGCATYVADVFNSLGLCAPASCSGIADGVTCFLPTSSLDNYGQCCSGQCVDMRADPTNCNGCRAACPAGFHCDLGCVVDGTNPPQEYACGVDDACPAGTGCAPGPNGVAACYPTSCGGLSDGDVCAVGPNVPGTCCGGRCTSVTEDPANCGQCKNDCGGALCLGGACQAVEQSGCRPACAPGEVCFLGQCLGPVCGERRSSCNSLVAHTGPLVACDPPCPSTDGCFQGLCVGPVCQDSVFCAALDGRLGLCCPDGSCIDLANDPDNCGGCGVHCNGQACVQGACLGAACNFSNQGIFCGSPGDTSSICCGTACVDSAIDPANCGMCGHTCPTGMTCQSGRCQ